MKTLLLAFAFLLGGLAVNAQQSNPGKPDLTVFPNPVIDNFTIRDANDAVAQVDVFNLIGKKVRSFEHVKGEYHNIGELPKGVYLVQLIDKSRHIITTQKIDKR